jgi:phosphinothricin acetyltransferase
MRIRTAEENDLPGIVTIYNQAVDERFCTGDSEPVSVSDRRDWFQQHSAQTYPIFVAADEGELLGWCSLSPYRPGRSALRTTAEISYYIDASQRGRGIGSRLVQHALSEAPSLGFTHLLAILMDVNTASIRLLEKQLFVKWGHLPEIARFDTAICGQFIYGREV